MRITPSHSSPWFHAYIPMGVTLFLAMLNAFPMPLPALQPIIPQLALGAVYYWRLYRPADISYIFLGVLGVLLDITAGTPLGCHAMVYILLGWFTVSRLRPLTRLGFSRIWLGFAVVAFLAQVWLWLVVSLFFGKVHPAMPLGMQWALTVLIYPPLHVGLHKLNTAFPVR